MADLTPAGRAMTVWWWPHPTDGGQVPDFPPVELSGYLADAQPTCGATNDVLALRCNREPHPPGTAHYQDDGGTVRAWPDPETGA